MEKQRQFVNIPYFEAGYLRMDFAFSYLKKNNNQKTDFSNHTNKANNAADIV